MMTWINDVLLRSIVTPDTVQDEFIVVILLNIVKPLTYNNPLTETLFKNEILDTDNDVDIETLLFINYIPDTVDDEFMVVISFNILSPLTYNNPLIETYLTLINWIQIMKMILTHYYLITLFLIHSTMNLLLYYYLM